jgi:predicted adenylyl cyclase CyaB
MPANVEIKARVRDVAALHARAAVLAEDTPVLLRQTDTFFRIPHGRLKLRDFGDGTGELIFYQRPDTSGPKVSNYRITRTSDPAGLRETLATALGVMGVVRKRRTLYLVGQTRVHVDEVEGLGHFMELEVVLREGQAAEEGEQIAQELMTTLGIAEADLLTGAYIDLLSDRFREPGAPSPLSHP